MRMKVMQAAACAVLLSLAALPASAQSSTRAPNIDSSKMDKHIKSYQDALKYYQNGQFKQAEQELKTFLDNVGQHAGGNFLMGLALANQGELDKARTSFLTTVKIDPTMVAPHGWLGAVEAALGNLPGAAAQKAELEKMQAACAGTCPKAGEITQGIQRIDENVAAVQAAQAQPRN